MACWLLTGGSLLPASAQTTDTLPAPLYQLRVQATDFATDALGNYYLVTPYDQLKKINEKGDSLGLFNLSRKFGRLSYIDAANPLKVLLFYGDFATIQVIDRFMNVINTIDLRKKKITQLKAVANSYDNQVWYYDEQEARLGKISHQGIIGQQSADLRQLIGESPSPEKIIDNDGLVYLYDPQKGVYIFDYYGAFKMHLPILNWSSFHAFNKTLYGIKDGQLQKQSLGPGAGAGIALPAGRLAPLKMAAGYNRISLLYPDHIAIFRVQ
jgi:hypothetical protein